MSELKLPAIEQAVVVRPGDVLILRFGDEVTPEQAERFREHATHALKERLPGVEVLLVGGGVAQIAAFRPGGRAEAEPT